MIAITSRRRGRLAAVVLFLAIFYGCASTPAEFDGLQPASGRVVFSLDKGVQIRGGSDSVFLARGDYRVIKQNAHGSMYAAPGYAVIRQSSRGYLGYLGGVWVPRDPSANARVFVLYDTSERLYSDLPTAVSVPADVERRMLEQAKLDEAGTGSIVRVPEPPQTSFEYGNPAYSPVAILITALLETQKGKPDVIAEVPRADFERLIGPAEPARSR